MGKKRIFEVARELGYTNRDLIDKLQKLGFDVKSHSSSVDADEVKRLLDKAEAERRAKTDERRISRGVIRRRPKDSDERPGVAESAHGASVDDDDSSLETSPALALGSTSLPSNAEAQGEAEAAPESVVAASSDVESGTAHAFVSEVVDAGASAIEGGASGGAVEAATAADPEAGVAATAAADALATAGATSDGHGPDDKIEGVSGTSLPAAEQATSAEVTPVLAETMVNVESSQALASQGVAGSDSVEGVASVGSAAAADQGPSPVVASARGARDAAPNETERAREKTSSQSDDDDDEPRRERREARMARPDRKRDESYDEEEEKPEVEDFGISEFDFMGVERPEKEARVAPPPPSTVVAVKKTEELAKGKIVRTIDPSVLKARLGASKRPEPPKDWGRPAPEVEVAASPKRELEVRKDASGKHRELVDVRKEAAKGKAGGRSARRREELSAKDLLEVRRGQVYYPAPNRKRVKGAKKVVRRPDAAEANRKPIEIGDAITAAQLSQQMSLKASQVISWLVRHGVMASMNQPLDHDTAATVCQEFGYEVQSLQFDEERHLSGVSLKEARAGHDEDNSSSRAPVVTVMGHVDHGKTSLLDYIRHTNVAGGEAGGITQRIAGYQVTTSRGPVTFLDTPGHAAFSQMRARGANVTDIVVLVVAADDGVMPQTLEAIDHAKSAHVPIIVAMNKIDKPEANPDRVLQQLADQGLLVEDWGGEVLWKRVSAKTGEGVEDLLEQIALQAEIMELKANPDAPAVGVVVEAHLDKGRGPVATVLIKEGTLRPSEIVVVGENIGKVRAMLVDGGRPTKEAVPSTPVEILGLDGVPNPGEELRVAESLSDAKLLAAHRRERRRTVELGERSTSSLQDLYDRIKAGEQKELRIIVKADAQGSAEAVRAALAALSTEKVKVLVISAAVGAIVESDVEFARASDAIVLGFGVRPDTKALKSARSMDVDVRTYDIIYEAVDEVRKAMEGLLSPVAKERYLGRAEVRQTFSVPKVGTVAGCIIVDGVVARRASIRLLRDSKPVYEGKLASLKRFKDDVREVKEGLECGMGIDRFNDIKVGDIIESFEVIQVQATLDDVVKEDRPTA
ncbi:MAG: translation initiation factor IF-2 [Deltaproteobacteria bacterium]|nr:translation initiation factor IF-2 [Deltaproteobacteria bacterium]